MNRSATQKLLNDNNAVVLVADLSLKNPEAETLMVELGNKGGGIPYMAIFPGKEEPITLNGPITKKMLIGRIQEALDRNPLTRSNAQPSPEVSANNETDTNDPIDSVPMNPSPEASVQSVVLPANG